MPWDDFHFLRPWWLLALPALLVILAGFRHWRQQQSGWQGVIAPHLYRQMVAGRQQQRGQGLYVVILLAWSLATVALAGPTWQRLPQPVYQVKAGHVVVMDMSLSMRATDVSPDRLTRAKYKAIDLVKLISEGETGLVAYAGDAFVISPLTADYKNLAALLPSLSPEIMPVTGSDPLSGLLLASELLTNAGYQQGDIYWITDGISREQTTEIQDYLNDMPFRLNVLAIGTSEGAPIRQVNGELLKDTSGQIVVPQMQPGPLRSLTQRSGGKFATISANESDIKALAQADRLASDIATQDDQTNYSGDQWQEMGPYLVLACLPLALLLFRRGIFVLFMAMSLPLLQPAPAQAADGKNTTQSAATSPLSWADQVFKNADQQGQQLYEAGEFEQAAKQFDSPSWQASAQYKAGNFAQALRLFKEDEGPEALYNKANTLAQMGQYKEALEAYQSVLEQVPEHPDAMHNKAIVEKLLEDKKQQEQDQQQEQEQQQNEENAGDQKGQQDQQGNQPSDSPQQNNGESGSSSDDQQNGQPSSNDSANSTTPESNEKQSDGAPPSSQRDEQAEQAQQKPGQQQDEPAEDPNAQPQQAGEADQSDPADPQSALQASEGELSEEDKENMQRLENLKKRIPDDPAYLLKRKMQLEAQQRRNQRPPSNRSEW